MTQAFRAASGGRIDRDRVIRFSFDGRKYEGFAGDTLASGIDKSIIEKHGKYRQGDGECAMAGNGATASPGG